MEESARQSKETQRLVSLCEEYSMRDATPSLFIPRLHFALSNPSMSDPTSWLSTPEQVRALRDELQAQGRQLVFTNGCFDLLHVGHVRYLRQARELGDALVVALNSDASVRELKGPTRPVTTEEDRGEILRALACVDQVVVFDEPRVTRLIEEIQPHIYTKGGDYTVESLNPEERGALERVGAKIEILSLVPGRSTTQTLRRVAEGDAKSNPSAEEAPLRIAVLGSGHGSNLEAIDEAIRGSRLNAKIELVLSDVAESRFRQRAQEMGHPTLYVDPGAKGWRLSDAAQKELCDHLRRHRVQVVVLAGFMRILKNPILSEFRDRIVNIHPSLLPKHKGREAWVQALEAGDTKAGCTVHLVGEEIDGGRILAQETVPILPNDNAHTLYQRIQEREHFLFPKVLAEWRQRGLLVD